MHLGGAAREETITATGSDPVRIPFVLSGWSRGVVVDITMDRAQWGRFTDFGVILNDSVGRQLGKKPLNYAFGRLQVEAEPGHGDKPVVLTLLPGFADPADSQKWSLHASIRLYADSSVVLGSTTDSNKVTIAPGKSATVSFTLPSDPPRPLAEKFVPLGLLIARVNGRSWTRETTLSRLRRRVDERPHRPGRRGAGILGRLARGTCPAGTRRSGRLPDDGLPRRSDDVHHAETAIPRPQGRVCAGLRAPDGADSSRYRRARHSGHVERRRGESSWLRRGSARGGEEARTQEEAPRRPRQR